MPDLKQEVRTEECISKSKHMSECEIVHAMSTTTVCQLHHTALPLTGILTCGGELYNQSADYCTYPVRS